MMSCYKGVCLHIQLQNCICASTFKRNHATAKEYSGKRHSSVEAPHLLKGVPLRFQCTEKAG